MGELQAISADLLAEAARLLRLARRIVVFTGAGVSAESGIATFRGSGGLWNNLRPQDLASPEGFAQNPQLVWQWYASRRRDVRAAEPNAAHRAIAKLERLPRHGAIAPLPGQFWVITQNVDNLHERAGTRQILKLHGDLFLTRCSACIYQRKEYHSDGPLAGEPLPSCPDCGGPLRPGVVWFGEELPRLVWGEAMRAVRECDLCLVVGTSAQVYPAAGLIDLAGGKTIEINPEPAGVADLTLPAPASILESIVASL